MSWMNVARVAKVLAILMFLLPWLVVSCNGSPLAEASGLNLAIGKMEPAADSPLSGLMEAGKAADADQPSRETAQVEDSEGVSNARLWVPGGAVLIVLALVLGFVLRPANRAAWGAFAGAAAALVVLGGGMAWTTQAFKAEMKKEMAEQSQGASDFEREMSGLAASMANAIRLEVKPGYWLTLIFLGLGAGAALMAAQGRAFPGSQPRP